MNTPMSTITKSAVVMIRMRPAGPRKNFVRPELPGTRTRMPRFFVVVGTFFNSRMPLAVKDHRGQSGVCDIKVERPAYPQQNGEMPSVHRTQCKLAASRQKFGSA